MIAVAHQRKQYADAEIEAVEQGVEEDGEGDEPGPDEGQIDRVDHRVAPVSRARKPVATPAARSGASSVISPGASGGRFMRTPR